MERPFPTIRGRLRWILAACLVAVAEVALLAVWQRNGYWDFSSGVYSLSAREWLQGFVPYRDVAAAQPPPVYIAGALLLAIHDGAAWLRVGLGIVDGLTAGVVGWCVWRLCGNRWAALAGVLIAPLLPIALHEHAQLIPETLAAPLLLLGAMCCAERRGTVIGPALLALAALCKLAFVLPAVLVVLCASAPRRALGWLLAAFAVLAAASLAAFGSGVWTEAVRAQFELGEASLRSAGGLLAQGAWNELPLVIVGGLGLWLVRTRSEIGCDRALLRTLAAAAGGGLLLGLTVFKRGSYINVLVVAEPALLVIAIGGAAWTWTHWPRARAVPLILGALLAAQSVSLLVHPSNPWIAKRPGARSGLAWLASPSTVDRRLAVARSCPSGVAYAGSPYLAFLSGHQMPGHQADIFIIYRAPDLRRFALRAVRDRHRCGAG